MWAITLLVSILDGLGPRLMGELTTAMAGTTAWICVSFPYVCQFAALLHLTVSNRSRFQHCIAKMEANRTAPCITVLFRETPSVPRVPY